MAKDEEKKGNPMADLKWFIIIILAFWFLSKSGFGFLGGINTKAPDTNNTNTTGKSFSSQSRAQIPRRLKQKIIILNGRIWSEFPRVALPEQIIQIKNI